MKRDRYNVVIIGAGTAGLVTAAATAGLGGRVALVERKQMGGDCLNYGCVPSKALIASARAAHQLRHADRWGLEAVEPTFAFEKVMTRLRARRAEIAPNDSQERFEKLGVDVFRGEASFISSKEVLVGGETLSAANFVIATGTRAAVPKIAGLDGVAYFTNETIFDRLNERPDSMLISGGGPIGCEMAQAFARLGVKVTLAHRGDRLLPKEDTETAKLVLSILEKDGVCCLFGASAELVRQEANGIVATFRQGGDVTEIRATTLLIATGRKPNFESLNLPAAGVRCGNHGVEVNSRLQTSQPHIFAAGDIAGPYQFTHMADYQARIVTRNILAPFSFLQSEVDYSTVPWCTYLDPEVAHVGWNEDEATRRGVAFDIYRVSLGDVDRAVVEDRTEGFVKVLTAKGKDRILGVTLIAAHAGDLLHEFVLAMRCDIGLSEISGVIHAYPTFAELARKAGDAYQKTRLTPLAKKVFRALYERARR